ncbi:hypothetical protein ACFC3Z_13440 [Enterococcus thailandicus]|uniref:hypothetical protein n=1 Tax=Enterococcus thailandicus TaxID=417368 RepID=UPI0035E28C38
MEWKTIEIIEKVDSLDFYKAIYNKACNCFWELRVTYFILALVGIYAISTALGIFMGELIVKTEIVNVVFLEILFMIGIVFWLPMFFFLYRRSKGRSKKYLAYLKDLKVERSLSNSDIDKLLEDILYLKNKLKKQRNILSKIILEISKLVVFPITVAIFTSSVSNNYLFLGIFFIFLIFLFFFYFWLDYRVIESFTNLGIKNFYMVTVVEKELEYMKTLKPNDL